MEEETKLQVERDKSSLLRHHSPTHGSRSSVVSPDRDFGGGKSSSLSDDSEVRKKLHLSDDGSDDPHDSYGSPRQRMARSEYRPPIPNRKPELVNKPKPAYSEPNLAKAVNSSVSNTPGGLLWKRRQNDNDIMTDITNTDKYHESRNKRNFSSSSSQLENKMDSTETFDNSVFSNSNGSLSEDLSITSAYHSRKPHYPSDNFSQGRSASIEVLSPRSSNDQSSRSVDKGQAERSESEQSVDKGGMVTRRSRADKSAPPAVSNPSKRLSREEIQAALERADTYLKPTSPSSSEESNKRLSKDSENMTVSDITNESSVTKDTNLGQKMTQSDSSAAAAEKTTEGLRSWAMYRKQRYSRTSENLEDKVGDITKLGSISDISVSGFRKASVENLAKQSEQPNTVTSPEKPADPFAAISQSSVLNRRGLRSQQKQDSGQTVESSASSEESKKVEPAISETNAILLRNESGSGINVTERDENTDTSKHSKVSSSGADNSRPIPVPRRVAPSPPLGPPPPLPDVATNSRHSSQLPPPVTHQNLDPPSPAPEPGLAEEEEAVVSVSQSDLLASIPPVPDLEPDVQMRNKAHFVSLEEPDETSDTELPAIPPQRKAG